MAEVTVVRQSDVTVTLCIYTIADDDIYYTNTATAKLNFSQK